MLMKPSKERLPPSMNKIAVYFSLEEGHFQKKALDSYFTCDGRKNPNQKSDYWKSA